MEKDTVNKKRDFGQKLQDFMASYRGKVIMNYAYSWGAAIVIAGTLFKLTHLPGANLMLWIGMGSAGISDCRSESIFTRNSGPCFYS